jgi:signal transduction histidine kinase
MRLLIENKKIDDPSLIEVFKPIETFLVQASDQLRMLSRSMNTDYIQQLDLKDAITLEVERLRNISQNKVELIIGDTSEEVVLDKNQQLMAFRIFQEILNNSIKHSEATKISIRYKVRNYILQVEDNGKGFSIDDVQYSNRSSGLNNMKKRAELAKMSLDIIAQPEKGSILTLNLNNANHER